MSSYLNIHSRVFFRLSNGERDEALRVIEVTREKFFVFKRDFQEE